MATNYTSLLGFALPTTGELSGTWGTTVNDSITELVEDSIAATATASVTGGDWTLSTTGSGAANEARCAILRPTGTPGTTRSILAPDKSKAYVIINQSNGAVVIKGNTSPSPTTGVTVAAGKNAVVAWDNSDFVKIASNEVVPVAQGGTGISSGTSGGVLAFTATGTIASSAALASGAIVVGGGAGVAPSTTTTGTGVVTAIGNAVNTTGGLVTQSGTLASSAIVLGGGASSAVTSTTTGTGVVTAVGNAVNTTGGLVTQSGTLAANNVLLGGGASTAITSSSLLATSAAVTTGTYIKALGYADTVTALGNTGTAINIDITSGGVFSATLTGNCTFTLRYPVSSGASSFTLILTNDATPSRTVAFAGGTFKYPDGSVTRTTTANATDIWFFMTPDGGTTYYVSIPMKNLS